MKYQIGYLLCDSYTYSHWEYAIALINNWNKAIFREGVVRKLNYTCVLVMQIIVFFSAYSISKSEYQLSLKSPDIIVKLVDFPWESSSEIILHVCHFSKITLIYDFIV